MTLPLAEIKRLMELAGKYPALTPVQTKPYCTYECPLCGGSGEIEDYHVSEGTETVGGGINTSIVGVQVFGIGEAMEAMEKLIPMMCNAMPAIIERMEKLEAVANAARNLREHVPDEDGPRWATLDETIAALDNDQENALRIIPQNYSGQAWQGVGK